MHSFYHAVGQESKYVVSVNICLKYVHACPEAGNSFQ